MVRQNKTWPLAERLWRKVARRPSGCWEWTGSIRNAGGYGGQIGRGGRGGGMVYTHRAAWELTHGPIPLGAVVMHLCDNPPCCNPAHLRLGTIAENNQDARSKGRARHGSGHRRSKVAA